MFKFVVEFWFYKDSLVNEQNVMRERVTWFGLGKQCIESGALLGES